MKKIVIMALAIGLSLNPSLFASHDDCFQPYSVRMVNRSGGDADVHRAKGIRGVSRKSIIENNSAITLRVIKRGASINVEFGPENHKTSKDIDFYGKEYHNYNPSLTLSQKGVSAQGFSQKPVSLTVKIENQSGGIARIIDSCDVSGRGATIANGKSTTITAKQSGYIILEAGPEKQKVRSKIVFAEQTGDQPSITIVGRGFISNGIQSKNLIIQSKRLPIQHNIVSKPTKQSASMKKNVSKKNTPAYTTTQSRIYSPFARNIR